MQEIFELEMKSAIYKLNIQSRVYLGVVGVVSTERFSCELFIFRLMNSNKVFRNGGRIMEVTGLIHRRVV